jgi:hypothetical protein
MAKASAGMSLNETLFSNGLGFKVSYLTAVVRNNNPGKARMYCEKDQRSAIAQLELTESERSHLTQPTSDGKKSAMYVNGWAGLQVLQARWRAGDALVGDVNFTLADALNVNLQLHLSRLYFHSALSLCPPAFKQAGTSSTCAIRRCWPASLDRVQLSL